ncbi:17702_t:CDS:2, partial [Cetraspora pellucida]
SGTNIQPISYEGEQTSCSRFASEYCDRNPRGKFLEVSSRQDKVDNVATLILDKSKKEPIKEQPSRLRGFLAGVVSGVTKLCVGHPFDTIKVRLQTSGLDNRFNGPLHCLKQTIRKEGFRALYKGATPPLVGWGMMDSVMLGSLHNYRLLLQGNDPTVKLSVFQHTLAGA